MRPALRLLCGANNISDFQNLITVYFRSSLVEGRIPTRDEIEYLPHMITCLHAFGQPRDFRGAISRKGFIVVRFLFLWELQKGGRKPGDFILHGKSLTIY